MTLEHIPDKDSKHIGKFAGSFNGYEYHGSVLKCGELSNEVMKKMDNNEVENLTLTELRTDLFFHFRACRFNGASPDWKRINFSLELIRDRVKKGKFD